MLNVVLYCPEIPQNTGNIMRTCSAFNIRLHLIEPLGFVLDDKHLRRSGMDYIKDLDYRVYPDYKTFVEQNPGDYIFFSRYGLKSFENCDFSVFGDDIYLIFGKESTGIPKDILKEHLDTTYRLPMRSDARSLNLSNCVAIGCFEALRQIGFGNLSHFETLKGKDWLLK